MLLAVVVNRMAMALVTLAGVAVVIFVLLRVVPGDPVAMMISPGASAADIVALKAHYGLDAPLPTQFWIWISGVVHGDFGTSITLHVYVTDVLASRLPATIELAIMALIVAVVLGGGVAVAGTLMRRTAGETVIDGLNSIMLAVPDFIWALALALALPLAAVIVRLLKQSLKEAMVQDYVLLARIKGFRELHLVLQEALRNAVGPTLALTGVQFTFLIGGTVIVERIFSYPGIGNLAIDAVINRDFPLIQGLVLLFGLIFILINLAVNVAVALLNPRLRHG